MLAAEQSSPAVTGHGGAVIKFVVGHCFPELAFPLPVPDRKHWRIRQAGVWKHPLRALFSEDGTGFELRYLGLALADRVAFGNPDNRYNNSAGGQWWLFNLPVPWGGLVLPLTGGLPTSTLWWPR